MLWTKDTKSNIDYKLKNTVIFLNICRRQFPWILIVKICKFMVHDSISTICHLILHFKEHSIKICGSTQYSVAIRSYLWSSYYINYLVYRMENVTNLNTCIWIEHVYGLMPHKKLIFIRWVLVYTATSK